VLPNIHKPGYNAASLRFGGEMLELDDMLFMNAGSPAAVKFVKDKNFAAMNGPFLICGEVPSFIYCSYTTYKA